MKKYRILSFLLAFALTAGLFLPATALGLDTATSVLDMTVDGTAALLVDEAYDEAIYEQDAHEKRYPASITKVVTALLVLEAIDGGKLALSDVITASDTFVHGLTSDGSTQNIKPTEQMTVNDLLHCLLITSANEAANILAEAVAGDVKTFVVMMNAKAVALGCENTNLVNCHGLHQDDHYTTAHDIYLFTKEAMKYPTFREIVGLKAYVVPATNLHKARSLHATNALISTFNKTGYYYKYAIGVKTGSTPEAGQCLVSAAVKDGKTLYAVVLGAKNVKLTEKTTDYRVFVESARLLEWGFKYFERVQILDDTFFAGTIPVTLSTDADYVGIQPQGTLAATLPKGQDPATFERTVTLIAETVEAPVQRGQVLGSVTVRHGDKEYGTLPLVAVAEVKRSEFLYILDQVAQFFSQLWVKLLLLVVLIVALVFILRWLLLSKRRRYGARGTPRRTGYSGKRRN